MSGDFASAATRSGELDMNRGKAYQKRIAKERSYAEREKLRQAQEDQLRQYYRNGGDMQNYSLIGKITGLSPTEADDMAKRLDLLHTREH
jgi:hypothetical protein